MMADLSRDDLIGILAAIIPPRIPVQNDIWTTREIAHLLKCTPGYAKRTYMCLPSFPNALDLPGHDKYAAIDVLNWAHNSSDSKIGRPRNR